MFRGLKVELHNRALAQPVRLLESEVDGHVHIRIGHSNRPADMAKLDLQVILKKVRGWLSPAGVRGIRHLVRAISGTTGDVDEKHASSSGDGLEDDELGGSEELDFRRLEAVLKQVSASAMHRVRVRG
jgi:hypothetical protein